MVDRFGSFAALLVGAGVVGWFVREWRRDRLQTTLVGRGWRGLAMALAVGAAVAAPSLVAQTSSPWIAVGVPGVLLVGVSVGAGVADAGVVPSWLATGFPLVLLAFAERGCDDTPSGAAAVCAVPPPAWLVALGAVAGAGALTAAGYPLGRGLGRLGRGFHADGGDA
ncbi:hypothetical protein C475_05085 [Halosimplex carlsbadense 2-9-1]|uniref:Uncharacterized protein n=1 Tax=Halosimplex carlsbadense 2-9-1 TaxID=797114 RepID=M0D0F4_9EURY|nr:hypothetical protein [Halosimplex carlsbadense]ELZ28152.1 hypothetical protein C475_05085 [Halosimplex carlsbadense 2-9-1]